MLLLALACETLTLLLDVIAAFHPGGLVSNLGVMAIVEGLNLKLKVLGARAASLLCETCRVTARCYCLDGILLILQ